MSESTRSGGRKRQPSWLTGEEPDARATEETPTEAQAGKSASRRGPLADATDEPPQAERVAGENADEGVPTATIPRVTPSDGASGAARGSAGGNSISEVVGRLRTNLTPALLALLVLAILLVFFWFVFLRGGGSSEESSASQAGNREQAPLAEQASPQAGGVDDTGIVFSGLDESADEAMLQGAGLEWEGSVAQKDGGAGETLTLKGPTAVQIQRGFEVDNSDVESGVYALAQDDGSVLHVATHTYQLVTQQQDEEPKEEVVREITLGTIFDLEEANLRQSGFYIDRHEQGSPKTLRTYYRGPDFSEKNSYEVSFTAPTGTPVPLLVGYREEGKDNRQTNRGEE